MDQTEVDGQAAAALSLVHRTDDNGCVSVVAQGLSPDEAERLRALLEARGHKQHYGVASYGTGRISEAMELIGATR